jgi:hypothetical protein
VATRPRRAPEPWEPVIIDIGDPRIGAIRALASGTATSGQQQLAWESILFDFCGIRDLEFRPGGPEGDRASCFAGGRRHVGLQLVKTSQLHIVQPKLRGSGPNAYPVGPEPGATEP